MVPFTCSPRATLSAFFLLLTLQAAAQTPATQPSLPTPTTTAKAASPGCNIDHTAPSEADVALAMNDYVKAEGLYRDLVKKDPTSPDGNLGVVRSLLGQDKIAEARAAANAYFSGHPKEPLAEVALGEVEFRDAGFSDARTHLLNAYHLNKCEARAISDLARIFEVTAYYDSERRLLIAAHTIRPEDELIRRDWISVLPRKQRQAELERYLPTTQALTDKDRRGYENELQYLKARQPGECRISAKPQTGKALTRVPLRPVYGDRSYVAAYGLDVSFDGKVRRLQIDTGASGITLSPGAAKRLGLTPEYRIKTGGVGDEGSVDSYLTHVANIQIGDVHISNCMVEVLQKSRLDVDGLIGMDTFGHWLVTLDYSDLDMTLSPLPPRPGAAPSADNMEAADPDDETLHDAFIPASESTWLPIVRISHELLVPASVNKGTTHYLMADTGADTTNLSVAYARESGKVHEDDRVEFSGLSGKVKKAYRLDNAELQFGNLLLPKASYFAFDLTSISHNAGVEVSGFIGLNMLGHLTTSIDYRDNLMKLEYDPKRDYHRF